MIFVRYKNNVNRFCYKLICIYLKTYDTDKLSISLSLVEVKKQSSCSIRLGNNSDQYVAFKVLRLVMWIMQYFCVFKKL